MQNLIHQSENKISLEDNSFFDDTNKKQLSLILQSNLISKENVCIPYWNTKCDDIQSTLWLPHKTVLKNKDLTLPNYQEEKPNYWQTIIKPKQVLEKNNLSSLLQPSVIVINENKSNQDINVITTKKIRIFPENLKAYKEALDLHRRSYNLAMSNYIDNTYIDEKGNIKNLRPEIRNIVKKESTENNTMFSSIIADNGVLEAKKTFLTVCKNNKNNKGNKTGFSSLKYKSKKGTIHSFKIDHLPFSGTLNIKELGKIHITEKIPQEAFRKTCVITCDKNRWYMNVQQITLIKGQVKCISVDQKYLIKNF